MKNWKNWQLKLLIVLGVCIVIPTFIWDLGTPWSLILDYVSAICIAFPFITLQSRKWLVNDPEYKVRINDERALMIKDKVGATVGLILLGIMSAIAIVCITINAFLPAILLGISIFCWPVLMILVGKYYENRY